MTMRTQYTLMNTIAILSLLLFGASPALEKAHAGSQTHTNQESQATRQPEAPRVSPARAESTPKSPLPPGTEVIALPRTTLALEMVPVRITVAGKQETILVARRETSWDVYDTYLYGMDQPDPDFPDDVDIVTRPTKPYINMDRGWGHTNFPAIGMSHKAATQMCVWLSHITGRHFRLLTQPEFEAIAKLSGTTPKTLESRAWYADNSGEQTHARASKKADDLGLFDLFGNVGEWCNDAQGKPIVCGGSYMDDPDLLTPDTTEKPSRSWNATDPQIPKSVWWLADCTWVGIRVACEPASAKPDGSSASEPRDDQKPEISTRPPHSPPSPPSPPASHK